MDTPPLDADAERVPAGAEARGRGIRASAARIVAHLRALAQLEKELARAELERKGATVGAAAALAIAAGILALYALGFGLATVAAALALVVDLWLALLIVFLVLVVVVIALGLTARHLLRAGTPFKPEQAIAEARLTKQVLRGTREE